MRAFLLSAVYSLLICFAVASSDVSARFSLPPEGGSVATPSTPTKVTVTTTMVT